MQLPREERTLEFRVVGDDDAPVEGLRKYRRNGGHGRSRFDIGVGQAGQTLDDPRQGPGRFDQCGERPHRARITLYQHDAEFEDPRFGIIHQPGGFEVDHRQRAHPRCEPRQHIPVEPELGGGNFSLFDVRQGARPFVKHSVQT